MLNAISYKFDTKSIGYSPKYLPAVSLKKRQQDSFSKTNNQPAFLGNPIYFNKAKFVEFLKNPFKNPQKILDKLDDFGMKEYKSLSERDKLILRKYYPFHKMDVDNTLNFYKIIKQNLIQRFPDGFNIVSIGRSPATFAKLFETEGINVKFCPISQMRNESYIKEISPQYINNYANYLKSIGLTKKAVKESKTPFVFIDYTYQGTSLKNFERLLSLKQIGIKGENAVFLSLNKDLLKVADGKENNNMPQLVESYFRHPHLKKYSPVQKVYHNDIEHNHISVGAMSDNALLMQFHLIDRLNT